MLDAIRKVDGLVVCLKMVQGRRKLERIRILQYLTSRRMEDAKNHVVPLFDTFSDCTNHDMRFLVMPVLRQFDDPEFMFGCEVVDFVTQVLEVCCVVMFFLRGSP